MAVSILLLALLLIGCGGGGSSTPSPFAGNWSGGFSTSNAENGNLNGTVGTDGRFTGAIDDLTTGANGTVTGSISNAGQANFTVSYPGQQSFTGTGTLTETAAGHLTGTL
jgi:hypothetical protein